MRVKTTFAKGQMGKTQDSVPIHHQQYLSSLFLELMQGKSMDSLCFSSLKGTSKVMGGQIRFLSTKVSLVLTASQQEFIEEILKKLFGKGEIKIEGFSMIPRSYQIISEPKFATVMRYICLSPFVITPAFTGEQENVSEPYSHDFSDMVFDSIITKMEQAGYADEQLNEYAEFELTPDAGYMQKIHNNPKKYARIYKNDRNENITGYLFPFSIHAHPEVHKFIWQRGLGLNTTEGYGMLDTVPETPPASDHITP